ncbi:hypothetical protein MYX76_10650 [Desulfobacterota bacterium AH_259_B03_O07]|nr:hypothetical protein [Desulfobacterota bacterium AH_259_B03_O07]
MTRTFLQLLFIILLILLGVGFAHSQVEIIRPRSIGFFGNTQTLFQAPSPILRPDRSKKNIYPFYQYFEFNAVSPEYNVSFNTFFRYREIFNGEDESFDVYNAFLQYNNSSETFEVRLGRQIIAESVIFFLLDGGLVRIKPIDGIQIVAYGGYQDKDLQPEPEQPLESFTAAGIKLKSDKFLGALFSIGYELYDPDNFSARHFLNIAFNRVVPFTDYADIYGLAEIDLGEGNLALLTVGVGITLIRSLYLNLEYDTYNLDKDRDEFRLDPIFDLFSVGRMHQAKVGFTFIATNYLEVNASYAFSRYEVIEDEKTSGNIVKVGFSWDFWSEIGLRAFNGFYFIDGRKDDYAFGLNFDITEEIYRGLELQFAFAYAYYDKITNQKGNAFSYIFGMEYLLVKDLVLRTDVEINTNPDFERDVRVDLGLSYYFSGIR